MIDCNKEITNFYNEKVRLKDVWNTLGKYREANLTRLSNGLTKNSNPQYSNSINQGSYAMSTIIQHPDNDYDIDIGIIFTKDALKGTQGGDKTALDTRKMVCEAMQDDKFKKQPAVLKNCVRVYYDEGHHVDMAIYRKYTNDNGVEIQELASTDWEESNPEAITKWFNKAVVDKSPDENNGKQLRRIVRLLKKWARSRNSWNIPSGLILSILSEECYVSVLNRDDESFYKTIKAIKSRLFLNKIVNNPTNGKEITSSDKHKNKVQNLYDKLTEMFDSTKGVNLSELETTQDKKKALLIWKKFFNDDFFESQVENVAKSAILTPNQPWQT